MGVMVAASVGPLPVTQAPTWLRRPGRPWFPHHCRHGPAGEWVAVTHLLSCPLHPETTGGVGGSVDADRRGGHSPSPPGPLSHRLGTSSGCGEWDADAAGENVTSMAALLPLLHLRGCAQGP